MKLGSAGRRKDFAEEAAGVGGFRKVVRRKADKGVKK